MIETTYRYLNVENYTYLCSDLTFSEESLRLLDNALEQFNETTGIPDYVVECNSRHGYEFSMTFEGPQYLIDVEKLSDGDKVLSLCGVKQKRDQLNMPPMVHFNLQSPTFDIPQRVEIPLRYLVKGGPKLNGTYMVYLHALEIDGEEAFSYYGLTRRRWMTRFIEHVRLALRGRSDRRFPKMLREALHSRRIQISIGEEGVTGKKQLTGSYHVVCAAGRSKENAHAIEAYLIEKRSHSLPFGLNMIHGYHRGANMH
ncbi:hypothetical protein LZD49_04785 [Dyadobacter sp. CY261]|uniref:hypothetical protein n=1 Tax=Dyadobacter sp. CY261 TaxID=2907203 RepID=UPI001F36F8BA|nr:hypothetical protein [Dyadobacter sp. CY261]MCF0069776.1 hypothetical protein [Dyadobacter sp. CY261]